MLTQEPPIGAGPYRFGHHIRHQDMSVPSPLPLTAFTGRAWLGWRGFVDWASCGAVLHSIVVRFSLRRATNRSVDVFSRTSITRFLCTRRLLDSELEGKSYRLHERIASRMIRCHTQQQRSRRMTTPAWKMAILSRLSRKPRKAGVIPLIV